MSKATIIRYYYTRKKSAVQYESENNKWITWIDIFKNKITEASQEAIQALNLITDEFNFNEIDNWIDNQNLADQSLITFLKDTNYYN